MTYELDLLIAVAFLAPVLLFVVLEMVLTGVRADVGRWKPLAEVVALPVPASPDGSEAANDALDSPMREAA
jgi:hypothetical protein